MEELIKYLKNSDLSTFPKEYRIGYKDCINDIKRFELKLKNHWKKDQPLT